MIQILDAPLKARLRDVLDGRPVTEADLRKLFEEGRACSLILGGRLERTEQELATLADEPESELAALAGAVREANELRQDLDELHSLLGSLEARAREFRAAWLPRPPQLDTASAGVHPRAHGDDRDL